MKIYKAWYDSRNFCFDAIGKTKKEALATLQKALDLHTQNFDLEPDWYYPDDMCVMEMEIGTPYRDRSPMKIREEV